MIPVYVLLAYLVLLGISLAFLAGDVLSHHHPRQVSSGGVRLLISTSRRHQQQRQHHLPSLPLTRLRTRPLYLSRLSLMT